MAGSIVIVLDLSLNKAVTACSPKFIENPDVAIPLTMVFDDKSTGLRNEVHWDFGDGNTLNSIVYNDQVSHSYASPGVYTVSITTILDGNECGSPSTYSKQIEVKSCAAGFSWIHVSGQNQMQFNNLSTVDFPYFVIGQKWDFGDGNISTASDPTHTFPTNGDYNVKLEIYSTEPCTSIVIHEVNANEKCCKSSKSTNESDVNEKIEAIGSNRGIKGRVFIVSIFPFYHRAGAKTRSFRLTTQNNWKEEKADQIEAGVFGFTCKEHCKDSIEWLYNDHHDLKTNERTIRYVTYPIGSYHFASHKGLKGGHSMIDNGANATTIRKVITTDQCGN